MNRARRRARAGPLVVLAWMTGCNTAQAPASHAPVALKARSATVIETSPWAPLPRGEVGEVCGLDPNRLEQIPEDLSKQVGYWMIVRRGQVCWLAEGKAPKASEAELNISSLNAYAANNSVTKTLTALSLGILFEQTGQTPLHQDEHLRQTLGFITDTKDAKGKKFDYEHYNGSSRDRHRKPRENLAYAVLTSSSVEKTGFSEEWVEDHVFRALGHSRHSEWLPEQNMASGWFSTMTDMARVGLLLLRTGDWCGEQLMNETWVDGMTQPSFPEINPGFGHLLWLNTRQGWVDYDNGSVEAGNPLVPCAPTARCGEDESRRCTGADEHDVGTWVSHGADGRMIIGHPGLDMLVITRDHTNGPHGRRWGPELWRKVVVPALVAGDADLQKDYADEASFCRAYEHNLYAPDLSSSPPWPETLCSPKG